MPADGDVLRNAPFYIAGSLSPAGQAAAKNPSLARWLSAIALRPGTERFSPAYGVTDIGGVVASYLQATQIRQPGTVPLLSTYYLTHPDCTHAESDTPAQAAAWSSWIAGVAQGIGNFHAVLFLEMDAVISMPCLSEHGRLVREAELRYAIGQLDRDPHLVIYLDGGAADAVAWQKNVQLLKASGVSNTQGFFLNSTHFDWTTTELYYGQRIARALGHGVHFVVNTGESGRGPEPSPDPRQRGYEELCNPANAGLGPLSTNTGYKWADAFLWTSNPGESSGPCRPGAPANAAYWPAYAASLAQRAVWRVTGPRWPLVKEG